MEIDLENEEITIKCPKCEGNGCKCCEDGTITGEATQTVLYVDLEPAINEGYI